MGKSWLQPSYLQIRSWGLKTGESETGSHSCSIWKHLSVSLQKFPRQGEESTPPRQSKCFRGSSPSRVGSRPRKILPMKEATMNLRPKPCKAGMSAAYLGICHQSIPSEEVEAADGKGWGWRAKATVSQLWCYKNAAAKQCGNRSLKHLINWETAGVISELTWKKPKMQHYIQLLGIQQEQLMGWE